MIERANGCGEKGGPYVVLPQRCVGGVSDRHGQPTSWDVDLEMVVEKNCRSSGLVLNAKDIFAYQVCTNLANATIITKQKQYSISKCSVTVLPQEQLLTAGKLSFYLNHQRALS